MLDRCIQVCLKSFLMQLRSSAFASSRAAQQGVLGGRPDQTTDLFAHVVLGNASVVLGWSLVHLIMSFTVHTG
jgi:hypothetical protein